MDEARRVLHASRVGSGVWTVERKVESEVGELLLQLEEILQVEHLIQGTSAIEVRHLAVCRMQGLCHVHDLRTERSHTRTTTDPHHLTFRIEDRMEIAIRATHQHLVARFEGKDIGRSDTRHHVHEAHLGFRFERRRSDTYRKHETVALGRIVGH